MWRAKLPDNVDVYVSSGDFRTHASQREAVGKILSDVLGADVCLHHLESGAPILSPASHFISISHCQKAVCVALSKDCPVGVDVESRRPQLIKIASRFLPELKGKDDFSSMEMLLTGWTYKEAAYKLLQNTSDRPTTMMDVRLFDERIRSVTIHLPEITVTIATLNS